MLQRSPRREGFVEQLRRCVSRRPWPAQNRPSSLRPACCDQSSSPPWLASGLTRFPIERSP
eukprot:4718828-Alexandrium_andersonii.AAC.1